jgi:hypothetical protein
MLRQPIIKPIYQFPELLDSEPHFCRFVPAHSHRRYLFPRFEYSGLAAGIFRNYRHIPRYCSSRPDACGVRLRQRLHLPSGKPANRLSNLPSEYGSDSWMLPLSCFRTFINRRIGAAPVEKRTFYREPSLVRETKTISNNANERRLDLYSGFFFALPG